MGKQTSERLDQELASRIETLVKDAALETARATGFTVDEFAKQYFGASYAGSALTMGAAQLQGKLKQR